MRLVKYRDIDGWIHATYIRDSDPDSLAPKGVPAGPPDLTMLDWEQIKKEINNALVESDLFTWDDVQRSSVGLRLAGSIVMRYIQQLYREDDIARRTVTTKKDKAK